MGVELKSSGYKAGTFPSQLPGTPAHFPGFLFSLKPKIMFVIPFKSKENGDTRWRDQLKQPLKKSGQSFLL